MSESRSEGGGGMTGARIASALRFVAAACLGYFCACAVVVLVLNVIDGKLFNFQVFWAGIPLIAMFSAPGFVVLRLWLWGFSVRHVLWFACAGAANGMIVVSVLLEISVFVLAYGAIGLAGGATYWLVERAIFGKVLV